MKGVRILAAALALTVSACGHSPPPKPNPDFNWHPPSGMLLKYDANHDGIVTRAEMEAGLRRDFAAADTNHDGKLDPDEARAVNEERLSEDQSAASPVQDWNQDGFIDFQEFATAPRSLFDQLDKNGDGRLTPDELGASSPVPPGQLRPQERQEPPGGDDP